MEKKQLTHWTEKSTADFLFRIGSDFVAQIETKMESLPMKQGELAEKLGVTKGRVSQIFNNPGNLTLGMLIKCARAVGMKASVVAYDDGDKENKYGPVHSDIFRLCWENAGRPRDVWSVKSLAPCTVVVLTSDAWLYEWQPGWVQIRYKGEKGSNAVSVMFPERPPTQSAVNRWQDFVAPNLPVGGGMMVTSG